MRKFAFISRHKPTQRQVELAAAEDIELVPVGDRDAFTVDLAEFVDAYDGVVVVHPAAALRLLAVGGVGIFENANRAPEGSPPQFEPTRLHVFEPSFGGDIKQNGHFVTL